MNQKGVLALENGKRGPLLVVLLVPDCLSPVREHSFFVIMIYGS